MVYNSTPLNSIRRFCHSVNSFGFKFLSLREVCEVEHNVTEIRSGKQKTNKQKTIRYTLGTGVETRQSRLFVYDLFINHNYTQEIRDEKPSGTVTGVTLVIEGRNTKLGSRPFSHEGSDVRRGQDIEGGIESRDSDSVLNLAEE